MRITHSARRPSARRLAAALLFVAAGRARAATVVIDDADPPGQGLNDLTPVVAVGGNPATTLGAARLAVFNQAAALWGAQLRSTVPIHVRAQMAPPTCTATSAVLASTGAGSVHRDFPSAPLRATWYPQALANALSGSDLDPATQDIDTQFNSALGNAGCLTGTTFYLGVDAHPGAGQIDMLTVVLHELAHGLGFQTYADFSTGAKLMGLDDAFIVNTRELGVTPPALSAMTDQQRAAAGVSDPDLYWAGPSVAAAASTLSAGLIGGNVRLNAPATFSAGSSVVHYSSALTPNDLMEAVYSGPSRSLALTEDLLGDVGWALVPAPQPQTVPALPAPWSLLLALALATAAVAQRARAPTGTVSEPRRRAVLP